MFKNRTLAVMAGTLVLAIAGTTGAVAGSLVTSRDIKNDTIKSKDVRDGTLKLKDMHRGLRGKITDPQAGDAGSRGPKGDKGDAGARGPAGSATYVGANWGVVHRNVIGNGDATLASSTQPPPLGVGALSLRTGGPDDKAAFGNERDFAGIPLASVTQVGYSVFTTGENRSKAPNNMPSIVFEIDPNAETFGASNFSSLVYAPNNSPAGWSTLDADADPTAVWGLTGAQFNSPATADNCGLNGPRCTYSQVQAVLNDGGEAPVVLSVQVGKGRDFAFSGAVDALRINAATYDFEPFGVAGN